MHRPLPGQSAVMPGLLVGLHRVSPYLAVNPEAERPEPTVPCRVMRGNEAGLITPEMVTIVPANQASWADLAAVFGTMDSGRCNC